MKKTNIKFAGRKTQQVIKNGGQVRSIHHKMKFDRSLELIAFFEGDDFIEVAILGYGKLSGHSSDQKWYNDAKGHLQELAD